MFELIDSNHVRSVWCNNNSRSFVMEASSDLCGFTTVLFGGKRHYILLFISISIIYLYIKIRTS